MPVLPAWCKSPSPWHVCPSPPFSSHCLPDSLYSMHIHACAHMRTVNFWSIFLWPKVCVDIMEYSDCCEPERLKAILRLVVTSEMTVWIGLLLCTVSLDHVYTCVWFAEKYVVTFFFLNLLSRQGLKKKNFLCQNPAQHLSWYMHFISCQCTGFKLICIIFYKVASHLLTVEKYGRCEVFSVLHDF